MIVVPYHVRGLVFDCDGTIAHTMPLHFQAWTQALSPYPVDFPEALFYSFGGVPTEKILQTLNDTHGTSMPVAETAHHKENLFEALIPHATPIEPIVEVIRRFHGKLPMAVATGGFRRIAESTLKALELMHYFDAMVCTEDVLHGKPAPDIFLEAARRIGVDPKDCMAFEDADMGIRSAAAAGMLVFDVRTL